MNSDYYINLHFNQAIPQKTGYAFKIGDKGCTFHLHCVDLNPTGMNPHIVFNHSNGTCVEGVPTGSGQDYVYVIQGNEFGVCGQVVVDMKFYDAIGELATQRISTASFTLDVIPDTLTPFDESSSSYADSLEHAREELEDATGDLADMDALFAQTLQDYIDAFGNTAPINPCGEYDPNELYKPRDAVYYTHDGKTVTYMNNLECTGIAPTNTSNWQPIIDIPSLPAVIDSCTSTSTKDALSANQGRVLNDNISAIINVNGSKNILPNLMKKPYTDYGGTFTPNSDGSVVVSGTVATQDIYCPLMGDVNTRWIPARGDYIATGGNATALLVLHAYSGNAYVKTLAISPTTESFTNDYSDYDNIRPFIVILNGTDLTTPVTVYPMVRDARIVDPTYKPYAETNLQLTNNKANRNELPHENLLRNAYFMGGGSQQGGHQFPINNEGLTSYPAGTAWGIDGWDMEETNNASMNILSDGIVVIHPNVAGTYTLHQYIDNYEQYIGKTLTVTFLGTLLEGTTCNIVVWYHPFSTDYRGTYLNTSFSDGIKSLTFTVPNDATGLSITIAASGANQPYKLKLQAAKLELGSVQTLAHKENGAWVLNDASPDFAVELAKCQTSVVNPYDHRANKGDLVTYSDLSKIHVAGLSNTTGAQINEGALFYLNGTLCKALTDIGIGNSFIEDTNYENTSISNMLDRKFDLLGSSTTLEGSVPLLVSDIKKYREILCRATAVYNGVEQDWTQNQILIPTSQILLSNDKFCAQSSHQLVPGSTLDNAIFLYVHGSALTGVDYWYATYTSPNPLSPITWVFRVYGVN